MSKDAAKARPEPRHCTGAPSLTQRAAPISVLCCPLKVWCKHLAPLMSAARLRFAQRCSAHTTDAANLLAGRGGGLFARAARGWCRRQASRPLKVRALVALATGTRKGRERDEEGDPQWIAKLLKDQRARRRNRPTHATVQRMSVRVCTKLHGMYVYPKCMPT